MNPRPFCSLLASAALLSILNGCGGAAGLPSTPGQSGPSLNPGPQSTVPLFARIVIESILERSIPVSIDTLVFRGLDSAGRVVFGPVVRAKAGRIVLEQVPLTVSQLQIEYFQGAILRGRGETPVTLTSGQEFLVNSPTFADIVYPLTGLAVRPGSLNLKRGELRPLELDGTYADQTTRNLAALAQWTAFPPGVVEISPEGVVEALQVGQCQVIAQLDGFSSEITIEVERPELSGLSFLLESHTMVEGQVVALEVLGIYQDGVQEVPPQLFWSSEDPQVASVNQAGQVEALRPGQTRILVQSGSQIASLDLNVVQDLTIQELFSLPEDLQLPKGLNAGLKLFGRYRDGSTVELTSLAGWSSSNPSIAQVTGVHSPYPVQRPNYSRVGLADQPPPFFPYPENVVGGRELGQATITAEFEGQSLEIPVEVNPPIPVYARILPALTELLTSGQSLQFQNECILSDATVVADHPQVSIESLGAPVELSGSSLATPQGPGSTLFRALFPTPVFPDLGFTRLSQFVDGSEVSPDYFLYPYDLAGIVVSNNLQVAFSSTSLPSLMGSILAESSAGVFWAQADRVGLSQGMVQLPKTSTIHSLGAGNFSGANHQGEVFFAGRRAVNGVDYGVIVSHTPEQRVIGSFPPQIIPAQTVYQEFSDTPHGLARAVTGDFDGNGRQDAAIFYLPTASAQQLALKVRLSDQGILDLQRPEISSPLLSDVSTGDVNADGHLDLVGLNARHLLVWLNDGQGNFSLAQQIPLGLEWIDRVAQLNLGDVDGDGQLDICFFRSQGYGWRDYFVYYGNGLGESPRNTQGSSGYRVQASRLADLTGDGKADLVTLQSDSFHTLNHSDNSQRRASLSIHPGSSQGFLPQQVTPISSDSSPANFLLRDQNGDGRLDLVASLQFASTQRPFSTDLPSNFGPVYQHYRGRILLRLP